MTGAPEGAAAPFYAAVYRLVAAIPFGRVTTYGTISTLIVGHARAARTVGWALADLAGGAVDELPWWRVINHQGRISISSTRPSADEQRARLEDEGVAFGADGRVDLDGFGWFGEPTG